MVSKRGRDGGKERKNRRDGGTERGKGERGRDGAWTQRELGRREGSRDGRGSKPWWRLHAI